LKKNSRARTPPLDNQAKRTEYIKDHLFNELRYLLGAATEWSIQHQLKLGIPGYEVQVYAMDSAFLHARTLFEFFLKKTGNSYYGCDQFLGTGTMLKSESYTQDWSGPLHSHLMHAQDRSKGRKLQTPDGAKDLNEMPVYFAREILSLWEKFEEALLNSNEEQDKKLGDLARDKRNEAINSARCVINSKVAEEHAQARQIQLKPVFG